MAKAAIVQVILRLLGVGTAALGACLFFFADSPVHIARPGEHLLVDLRWLGAWAVLAGHVAWTGAAWLRMRKDGRPFSGVDYGAAWIACLLFGVLLLRILLRPTLIV